MKIEKVCFYIISFLFIFSVIFSGVQSYRVFKYEQQLGQYRAAVEQFGNYEQSVRGSIQSARECISSARGSVQELRDGLRELEEIFIQMENNSDCFSGNFNFGDSNSMSISEVEKCASE